MKTNLIILMLLITACRSEPVSKNVQDEFLMDEQEQQRVDSMQKMMDFISYVDSAGVVEQVSSNFIEMKETNEKLESTLEETREELQSTREELVETKVALVKSEKIVRAVLGDSTTDASSFKLLPIQK